MADFFVDLDGRPTRAPVSSPRCSTSKTSSPRSTPTRHPTPPPVATEQKAATREHHSQQRPRPARAAGHRAALVGVRQLGHPLQGVRHAGHPARPVREDRGCRAGATAYTALAPTVALHIPWDKVDDYDDLRKPRRRPRRRARHDQLEHLPGRRLQVRRPHPRRRRRAAEGDRPPLRVHRHHGRDRLARPEDLARRGLELPGPGRHARPPGPPARLARDDLRAPRRRAAPRARVQVLRAGVLPHRCSRLGHLATPRSPRSATRRWSASTPATTRPARTSSSSSCSCCASASSARSTSTRASTPTTTSSWAPPTRSSCSASSSR